MHGRQHISYKHQKLVATPGQRSRRLISWESQLRIPMCGSNCLGSQTQNSVPEDGLNETTHHVLLHGLSSLPLPNHVHTLSSHTVGHGHNHSNSSPRWIRPDMTLSIASITSKHGWVVTTWLKKFLLMLVGFNYLLWQRQVMQRNGFNYRNM
jgi:hypothetical protein